MKLRNLLIAYIWETKRRQLPLFQPSLMQEELLWQRHLQFSCGLVVCSNVSCTDLTILALDVLRIKWCLQFLHSGNLSWDVVKIHCRRERIAASCMRVGGLEKSEMCIVTCFAVSNRPIQCFKTGIFWCHCRCNFNRTGDDDCDSEQGSGSDSK